MVMTRGADAGSPALEEDTTKVLKRLNLEKDDEEHCYFLYKI